MITVPLVPIAAQVDQASEESPLRAAVEELVAAPSEVRYEFARQVFKDFSISQMNFRHLPIEKQKEIARRAFYVAALGRVMIIPPKSQELVDIVNRLGNGSDPDVENIALSYEKAYHDRFKTWPPIVPVNVDALIKRMLDEREIR